MASPAPLGQPNRRPTRRGGSRRPVPFRAAQKRRAGRVPRPITGNQPLPQSTAQGASEQERSERRARDWGTIDAQLESLRRPPQAQRAPRASAQPDAQSSAQPSVRRVQMMGKRSQPAKRPAPTTPRQPVKVQIVPGAKQREPGTPPEAAIFVLGMGLVAVALLHSIIIPGFDLALNGKNATHKYTLPAAQAIALVAFVFLLVWVSDISDGAARAVFWFLLALWAVYLLLSPDRPLQWVAGLVGAGGSEPASTAANTATPQTAKVGA